MKKYVSLKVVLTIDLAACIRALGWIILMFVT